MSDRFHLSNTHGGIVNATEAEVREHGPDFSRFAVGDRLYVRENHALVPSSAYRMSEGVQQTVNPADRDEAAIYAAGWDRSKPRWRPSIHMPRWASRLTLLVTDVRVERLQDISEVDAIDEGALTVDLPTHGAPTERGRPPPGQPPSHRFRHLWNSINGSEAWAANPWVVAVTFSVHARNIDQLAIPPAATRPTKEVCHG